MIISTQARPRLIHVKESVDSFGWKETATVTQVVHFLLTVAPIIKLFAVSSIDKWKRLVATETLEWFSQY